MLIRLYKNSDIGDIFKQKVLVVYKKRNWCDDVVNKVLARVDVRVDIAKEVNYGGGRFKIILNNGNSIFGCYDDDLEFIKGEKFNTSIVQSSVAAALIEDVIYKMTTGSIYIIGY